MAKGVERRASYWELLTRKQQYSVSASHTHHSLISATVLNDRRSNAIQVIPEIYWAIKAALLPVRRYSRNFRSTCVEVRHVEETEKCQVMSEVIDR